MLLLPFNRCVVDKMKFEGKLQLQHEAEDVACMQLAEDYSDNKIWHDIANSVARVVAAFSSERTCQVFVFLYCAS